MIYTAVVEQHSTEWGNYVQTVKFNAKDREELNDLLDMYADEGPVDPRISVDDSKMPQRFYESGGFASKLISFTDEAGTDHSDLANGAF